MDAHRVLVRIALYAGVLILAALAVTFTVRAIAEALPSVLSLFLLIGIFVTVFKLIFKR